MAGRERAWPRTVGMMQYAQWQSQPSWTLTNPRVRPVAPETLRQRISWSVSAQAAFS